MLQRLMLAGIGTVVCAVPAFADNFTETFENGNPAGWTFGSPNGFVDGAGGNPGAYYHDTFLDTFNPNFHTTRDSIFTTRDFAALGVTGMSLDMILHHVDFTAAGRQVTLSIETDNGTPADPSDDYAAYYLGGLMPQPGDGWKHLNFPIDSSANDFPVGWQVYSTFDLDDPVAHRDWQTVMTNVSEVSFWGSDPTLFYIFQGWNLGVDNVSISYIPTPSASTALLVGAGLLARRRRR